MITIEINIDNKYFQHIQSMIEGKYNVKIKDVEAASKFLSEKFMADLVQETIRWESDIAGALAIKDSYERITKFFKE